MDVREFVRKQESALKKYRRIYKLLDFTAILIILYTLMVVLSVDKIFPIIDSLELRTGTSYNLAGINIPFENVAMFLIAAFMSLIMTLLLHIRDKKTSAIMQIEEKHPNLQERLRTAYDNSNVDNLIVNDLLEMVSSNLAKVKSSEFLKRKRITFGLMLILTSVSVLTFITVNDIHTDTTPEDWQSMIDTFLPPEEEDPDDLVIIDEGEGDQEGDSGNEDLTGEPAVVVVDGKEVDLSLPPGTGTGFQANEEAEEIIEEFEDSPGGPPEATPGGTYYEELPDGYESVIKSYFEQLAEE
ncbi:hypothetical protein V7O62_03030 [Methanolobus sp. ZRKC2]|uniref:DUF7502 family protein n=1 Tax=Methanolobus sp. ZRKC2 TaxID=3125783 RepID=UPI00324DA473